MSDLNGSGNAAPVETSDRGDFINISVTLAPKVTFASHQCDVPVISDLSIVNNSGRDLEDLTLVLVSDPPVLGERRWTFDRVVDGSGFHVRDRRVSLAGGYLDALTERVRVDVTPELRQGGTLWPSITVASTRAYNEWGGANTMPELLAAFVLPNDQQCREY